TRRVSSPAVTCERVSRSTIGSFPVVENGPTAMWNLCRLCARHHYLRHHKGFRLEGGPGTWQWLPPEQPPPRTGSTGTDDADDTDAADPSNGSVTSAEPDQLFRLE
ncbi:MAG: hypothetical protein WBW80_09955, partial [Acidimicrobiales bacterium]